MNSDPIVTVVPRTPLLTHRPPMGRIPGTIGLRNKVDGEAEARRRRQRELAQAIKEKQTELGRPGAPRGGGSSDPDP